MHRRDAVDERFEADAVGARRHLTDALVAGGDLTTQRVAGALREVPRHRFLPGVPLDVAYANTALAIGHEQTISQPAIVAIMTEALELTGGERVLEIGTGSGYQAAVLSLLAHEIYTVEVVPELADDARARLAELGYRNVHVRTGDGRLGWPERAPFDRVIATAAPHALPEALFDQLADGGVLVAPVGPTPGTQRLYRFRKVGSSRTRADLGAVRFVPMISTTR